MAIMIMKFELSHLNNNFRNSTTIQTSKSKIFVTYNINQ